MSSNDEKKNMGIVNVCTPDGKPCPNCYYYNSPCLNCEKEGLMPDYNMNWEEFKKASRKTRKDTSYEDFLKEVSAMKIKVPELFGTDYQEEPEYDEYDEPEYDEPEYDDYLIPCRGPYNDALTRCFGPCCN